MHTVDFGSADGRGRWRLVYDKYPDETVLSDGGANGIQGGGNDKLYESALKKAR